MSQKRKINLVNKPTNPPLNRDGLSYPEYTTLFDYYLSSMGPAILERLWENGPVSKSYQRGVIEDAITTVAEMLDQRLDAFKKEDINPEF